jgi:hypothetical protein
VAGDRIHLERTGSAVAETHSLSLRGERDHHIHPVIPGYAKRGIAVATLGIGQMCSSGDSNAAEFSGQANCLLVRFTARAANSTAQRGLS